MLQHLSVRNLAIIDALELDLASGFSVLTGETGAGKSILLDAIGLALGNRADADVVRSGSPRAEVSAQFSLDKAPAAASWLADRALDDPDDPQSCTLRRVVSAEGGSRAFINGSSTTVGNLRELGELLLDIHGQHDSQRLMRSGAARELLDAVGNYDETLGQVRHCAQHWTALGKQLQALNEADAASPQQLEFLRFQIKELEAAAPTSGEMSELAAEHKQLANAGRLIGDAQAVVELLSGDDGGAAGALARATHLLQGLAALDSGFSDALAAVESAQISVEDAAAESQRRVDDLDLDPSRLDALDARIGTLHQLARKHQVEADALPDHLAQLQQSLSDAENADQHRADLEAQRQTALDSYQAAANALTTHRQQAAKALSKSVTDYLQPLGMADATVVVEVIPQAVTTPSPLGVDQVQLLVSANRGQAPRPLAKVASGGELSRISLALQLACTQSDLPGCMIFDEVDAGIGGGVAEIVGQRLHQLSKQTQVLCVTHLPQVASQADQQLHVRKQVVGDTTQTHVETLDTKRRVAELARMLGGAESSKQATAHAQSMLDAAQKRAAA